MTTLASQILSLQGLIRNVEKSVNDYGSAAHYQLNDDKLHRARFLWLGMETDGLALLHDEMLHSAADSVLNAKVHLAAFDDEHALRCLRYADAQLESVVDALAPKVQS